MLHFIDVITENWPTQMRIDNQRIGSFNITSKKKVVASILINGNIKFTHFRVQRNIASPKNRNLISKELFTVISYEHLTIIASKIALLEGAREGVTLLLFTTKGFLGDKML